MIHFAFPRRRVVALLVPALLAFSSGCSTFSPSESAPLRVGCDFDNEPFASIDSQGRAVGRDVDMMNEIGKVLGQDIQFVRIPFNDLFGALERNEIDVICATLGITEERAKRVEFSPPYFATRISVLVRSDGPKTLRDLAGQRVSASPNTTSEFALTRALKDAIPVLDNPDKKKADLRVLNRDVAGAVIDGPDADDFAKASHGELVVIAEPLAVEHYAMAMRKDDQSLHERIRSALDALTRAKTLDVLDARYGLRSDSRDTR